jgi:hypothetical protein
MSYEGLLQDWALLSSAYPGWNLKEIKKFTPRERTNWLEIAIVHGKVVRNVNG